MIIKGTTPNIKLNFTGYEIASITKLSLVFSQSGNVKVEKKLSDFTVDGNYLCTTLTERETLALNNGTINYQVRVAFGGTIMSTLINSDSVTDILKEEEL